MARCSGGGDAGRPPLRPLHCRDDGASLVASCDGYAHCDPIWTLDDVRCHLRDCRGYLNIQTNILISAGSQNKHKL